MRYFEDNDLWLVHCIWYAVDRSGRLARMDSGGGNAVPQKLSKSVNTSLYLYFEHLVLENTSADIAWEYSEFEPESREEYLEAARRGLYSYDHGEKMEKSDHYRRLTVPPQPLLLDDIPQPVRDMLKPWTLPTDFEQAVTISNEIVLGGKTREVPKDSEIEEERYRQRDRQYWKDFLHTFHLRPEYDEARNVYHLKDVSFCPHCFDNDDDYVETEVQMAWGERGLVPVYWSKPALVVREICPRCGYVSEYEAPKENE